MLYRCILPDWASQEFPNQKKVLEGEFEYDEMVKINEQFYNIYFLPNSPSKFDKSRPVDGSDIDQFDFVFVDYDLKSGTLTKEQFTQKLKDFSLQPTLTVDSGNGIHAYWMISDLDAMSFLKLQRRLMRKFDTDPAVAKIYQLMRYPNTINTKNKNDLKECKLLYTSDTLYTCEELDNFLSPITKEDEEYCQNHYNKTYKIPGTQTKVSEKLPAKFGHLLRTNKEAKELWSGSWSGNLDDRSGSDFKLGHLMYAQGFTKEEALSVLVNTNKAISRAPVHRISYAEGIVDKIWTYEKGGLEDLNLSKSVKDILEKSGEDLAGIRFPCHKFIDDTKHGFRLGQVIGLVAGSGVGKTTIALNMFKWFVERNPEYVHFFVTLEQPEQEIALRWKQICGEDEQLHNKVHIIGNYNEDKSFRHLSFDDIREYLLKFQTTTKRKVGCVVVDHIGALKKKGKDGENQDLMTICHQMKSFAQETNTMLVMQSQAPREKAGSGDLELDKDAAYGTVYFESYCDYLITIWQPLKRCYSQEGCPTVTTFKFCKIRHKLVSEDKIQEDVNYTLYFDPKTAHLRELTQQEETSVNFWLQQAVNKRKRDKKTEIMTYQSRKV